MRFEVDNWVHAHHSRSHQQGFAQDAQFGTTGRTPALPMLFDEFVSAFRAETQMSQRFWAEILVTFILADRTAPRSIGASSTNLLASHDGCVVCLKCPNTGGFLFDCRDLKPELQEKEF